MSQFGAGQRPRDFKRNQERCWETCQKYQDCNFASILALERPRRLATGTYDRLSLRIARSAATRPRTGKGVSIAYNHKATLSPEPPKPGNGWMFGYLSRGIGRLTPRLPAFVAFVLGLVGLSVGGLPVAAQETVGAPQPWQMNLQPPATPIHAAITDFHTLLLWIIFAIAFFVMALLIYVMVRFNARANPEPSKTSHNTVIEVVWTVVPVVILIVIAVPSFELLYYQDETRDADLTVKAIGRQWYWDYEYPDHDVSLSSFMLRDEELQEGQPRLLAVTERLVLPVDTKIRVLVTAGDVLHSWAVPAFGVKMDAVPGRINETWIQVEEEGIYYGFCSELCGQDHSFMPVAVEVVSKQAFEDWIGQRQAGTGGDRAVDVALGTQRSDG